MRHQTEGELDDRKVCGVDFLPHLSISLCFPSFVSFCPVLQCTCSWLMDSLVRKLSTREEERKSLRYIAFDYKYIKDDLFYPIPLAVWSLV